MPSFFFLTCSCRSIGRMASHGHDMVPFLAASRLNPVWSTSRAAEPLLKVLVPPSGSTKTRPTHDRTGDVRAIPAVAGRRHFTGSFLSKGPQR